MAKKRPYVEEAGEGDEPQNTTDKTIRITGEELVGEVQGRHDHPGHASSEKPRRMGK